MENIKRLESEFVGNLQEIRAEAEKLELMLPTDVDRRFWEQLQDFSDQSEQNLSRIRNICSELESDNVIIHDLRDKLLEAIKQVLKEDEDLDEKLKAELVILSLIDTIHNLCKSLSEYKHNEEVFNQETLRQLREKINELKGQINSYIVEGTEIAKEIQEEIGEEERIKKILNALEGVLTQTK